MESTALVLAHSHARNAASETHKANPIAASEEHDLAAGEFANASKSTKNTEALRTLKLLEQYHQRLAELLRFNPEDLNHPTTASPETSKPSSPVLLQDAPQARPKTIESSPRHLSNQPPAVHLHHRDLTSSIASNLASARGIPSDRQRRSNQAPATLSPQNAEGKVSNPARRSRLGELELKAELEPSKPSALLPSRARVSDPGVTATSPTRSTLLPAVSMVPEDSFSRFYATFEGLLSKLSAPLAFAGLPLTPEEPPKQLEKPKPVDRATIDPDVTRVFSKAALRVIREENGFGGAAESFYVVPTTGGTMSYAGMLSRTESGNEEEEFVDARETPQAGSSALRRRPPRGGKTLEELQVENEAYKAVALDLGDRLRVFELNAQKSSMALHMSMRALASPTASAALGKPLGTQELEKRVKELEEELGAARKEVKKLGKENAKLMTVVERYRERWEALKSGARERIKGEGELKRDAA